MTDPDFGKKPSKKKKKNVVDKIGTHLLYVHYNNNLYPKGMQRYYLVKGII